MSTTPQNWRLIFLLLYLLQVQIADVFAADMVLDADRLNQTPASLTEYFSVLEDPGQTLSLTEVQRSDIASRFTANHAPAASLNYGYTTSAYWLRFTLKNDTARLLDRMLEISYSDLSDVQFYQPLADGTYKSVATGFAQPFATRPYANRFFVFPVALPEYSEQVYYLRIQSNNGMVVPIRLWELQAFHTYERKDYSVQAWYFGMVVAIAIFNLLIFFALRDVVYLMYVSYVMSFSLGIAAQNGLGLELLWADTHRWSDISTTACFTFAGGFAVIFIRKMLNTRTNTPRFDLLLRTYVGISLLVPIMYAAPPQTFGILSNEIFNQSLTLFDGVGVILDVGIGIYLSLKHQRSAFFFLVAFLLIAIGASISILRDLGLLPFNTFTVNAMQFGSAIEMLLLAFALADRFNLLRLEKSKAQDDALKAQLHLVEHLQSHERVLEARVAERTDKLQILNCKLEALSTTDGLTGIANRRRFDEILDSEWSRAARMGQALAIAMLDVDWFKKYNDHYGHQAGDDCLRRVAAVLAGNICRTGDLVARYGGEEFVLIAPATDGESALTMVRKVCEKLEALGLPHELSAFGCVTVSIGVASMVPDKALTSDVLVKYADEALYRAKEQGRNRAVLA